MTQPCGGQPVSCGGEFFGGNSFTIVLVLFVLLAIIGCICF